MVWIVVRNILGAVESASPSPRCWECFGTIDCLPNLKINRVDLSSITCSNRSLCHNARRSVNERDCLQTDRSSRELIAGEGHLSLSPLHVLRCSTQDYIGARSPEQDLLPHAVPCVCPPYSRRSSRSTDTPIDERTPRWTTTKSKWI
jgi:hypothetical protein